MKDQSFRRAILAGYIIAILVASVSLFIPLFSPWSWLGVVLTSGIGTSLSVYFSDNIAGAVKSGLKRLPWILFTAGLLTLGIIIGWTDIGFTIVYLLGVSAFALIMAMIIASVFKTTRFGRGLSDKIFEGILYGVAFMRLPGERIKGNFGNYIQVIRIGVSRFFE